jgi:transcriptional regulator with XRE-family HTH domain
MADQGNAAAQEFGRRIKARREELGLSRRDLVAASGLSYPYVSQLETGHRLPSHKSVAMLARALELDPSELSAAIPYADMTPVPVSAMMPAGAASDVGGNWRSNPSFKPAGRSGKRPRDTVSGVARQVSELVATLPSERRLDALHQAQRQVLEQLLMERSGDQSKHR